MYVYASPPKSLPFLWFWSLECIIVKMKMHAEDRTVFCFVKGVELGGSEKKMNAAVP